MPTVCSAAAHRQRVRRRNSFCTEYAHQPAPRARARDADCDPCMSSLASSVDHHGKRAPARSAGHAAAYSNFDLVFVYKVRGRRTVVQPCSAGADQGGKEESGPRVAAEVCGASARAAAPHALTVTRESRARRSGGEGHRQRRQHALVSQRRQHALVSVASPSHAPQGCVAR